MYSVKTQELILLPNLAVQRVSQLPGDCQQPGQRPVVQQGAQAQEPLLPVRYVQGWKFMSCSHCQELGQQASWLLIGPLSEARSASCHNSWQADMTITHKFPLLAVGQGPKSAGGSNEKLWSKNVYFLDRSKFGSV